MGGIPADFREEEVYQAFARVGKVAEVRLPKRADGSCVGCAYVTFLDDLAAQRACDVNTVPECLSLNVIDFPEALRGRVWVGEERDCARGSGGVQECDGGCDQTRG